MLWHDIPVSLAVYSIMAYDRGTGYDARTRGDGNPLVYWYFTRLSKKQSGGYTFGFRVGVP